MSDISDEEANLKAILFFDLVDSSRLMSAHEQETVEFLQHAFAIFRNHAAEKGGEIVKTTGDGALVLFDTVTQAIDYAVGVHNAVTKIPIRLAEHPSFRAGIHVGEVVRLQGDAYGHAVNVTARLEAIADPGETFVSAEVFALARNNSPFAFEAIGGRRLRNIPEHMAVYQVRRPTHAASHTNAAHLAITTIGGLRLTSTGTPPTSDNRFAPVGYLALSPESSEAIGRLCALFWPDRDPASGRRALNRLFRDLGERHGRFFIKDALSVGLELDSITVDLETLERELKMGNIDPMLLRSSDWSERILSGTETIGDLYASWLLVARSDWRTRIAQALELCLDHFQLGDDGLRDAAIALLHTEPGHERAARMLIRHYHHVGNPGAAVRVYQELRSELDLRFGITPRPETLAAARGEADTTEWTSTRGGSMSAPLRIQVMAFESLDHEAANRLKIFRSEILASLACFRGWIVVEGSQPDSGLAGRPDYRLTATGPIDQNSPQVTITLSEITSGRVVWSDMIEIAQKQFLTSGKTAVGRIAAALEVYISTDRAVLARHTPEHSVVDDWLQAERKRLSNWTPQAHDEAARIHQNIITRAPDYAPAYASLAGIYNVSHIVRPGIPRDAESSSCAYELAKRASDLDPLDARNQLVVAWAASLEGDFDKASLHMEMAAKLNPNSPRTLVSCAMGFAFFGEHDRASRVLAHSLECSPMLQDYQWCYAASIYYLAGDLDAALQSARRGRDAIPDNWGWYAAILSALGRTDDANSAFTRLVDAVGPAWSGKGPVSREAVYAWFQSAYPLRRDQERQKLAFLE